MTGQKSYTWIKLPADYLMDADFLSLSSEAQGNYTKLYLMACKSDCAGLIAQNNIGMKIKNLAFLFHIKEDELKRSVDELIKYNFVHIDEQGYCITRYQDDQDRETFSEVEKKRKDSTNERQRKHRANVKISNVTEEDQDKEKKTKVKDKKEEKEENKQEDQNKEKEEDQEKDKDKIKSKIVTKKMSQSMIVTKCDIKNDEETFDPYANLDYSEKEKFADYKRMDDNGGRFSQSELEEYESLKARIIVEDDDEEESEVPF